MIIGRFQITNYFNPIVRQVAFDGISGRIIVERVQLIDL
jgi:hypothetical protein